MVTRFAASLRTDISPRRKEARPLSHALTSDQFNFLTSRLCGLMVRRWRLTGHFPILCYPSGGSRARVHTFRSRCAASAAAAAAVLALSGFATTHACGALSPAAARSARTAAAYWANRRQPPGNRHRSTLKLACKPLPPPAAPRCPGGAAWGCATARCRRSPAATPRRRAPRSVSAPPAPAGVRLSEQWECDTEQKVVACGKPFSRKHTSSG